MTISTYDSAPEIEIPENNWLVGLLAELVGLIKVSITVLPLGSGASATLNDTKKYMKLDYTFTIRNN